MKKTFLFALAALALAISCQKNSDINDKTEVTPEPVMRTVTCTIANPGSDSKVAINATTGKTEWEVDDEILFHGKYTGVHDELNYSVVVKLTAENISEDKKSFTATIPAFENAANQAKWEEYGSKSNIIAAYPASAVAVHYGDNWYYQNKFNATNLPLMSGFNDDYDSNHFTFYNLTGILSFVVTGDIDSYTLAGNNSEAIAYSDYASRLYKKTSGSIQEDWVYAGTPITSISGTITPGAETRVCIPGGVTFSGGFTITFSNGGTPVKTLSTTKEVKIPRNSYRSMGNVTGYLKDYVAPTTHDSSIDITGATDLSATASANCYIVDGSDDGNVNKVFKFKAYKGNSDTNVGTVSSVEILWETYNNATDVVKNSVIADVDFDKKAANNYYEIVFKMPATLHAGNAVIAAKNAGGTILWSWHIWVPSTSIADIDATNICGATMMDRNLGALEKVSTTDGASVYSLGMIYQWGRKDPFPGGKRITDTWPNPATVAGSAPSVHAGTVTMAYAIEHPTEFASNKDGDWQTTSDMTRWNKDTKTINDPCPPGYKIPYGDRNSKPLWNTENIATAATGAGLTWEINATGYWFKIADGEKELVFPLAGYVADNASSYGIGYTQTRAAIWCLSDSSSKYHLNIRSGSTMAFGSTSAARGCSIRCVRE